MPNLPTSPYDTANDALTDAIIFANDAGSPNGISGNLLNPGTNPAVLPALKERYRYLQQRLISSGVDTFTKEAVVYNLTQTQSSNPRVRMFLTYNGYWDGAVWAGPNISAPGWSSGTTYTQGMTVSYGSSYYVAQPNAGTNLDKEPDSNPTFWAVFSVIGPALPADLLKPLELWEVQSGTQTGGWVPMKQVPDAINVSLIQPRFQQWGFASDRIILPGASFTNDLRIKYLAVAPDITTLETVIYPRACSTALALLLLDQLSMSRGGPMAALFKSRAEEAISQIINQTVRKQAYAQFVRAPYRGRENFRGRRSGV